jgi:hypothetical protein
MDRLETIETPVVFLGHTADDSIAASVYVLVRHGVQQRPALAEGMRGSVRMRFLDDYPSVRIEFRGAEIAVADCADGHDRACDLELSGRLGDVSALIAAPLAAGLPKPTTRGGRRALARLADGRIDLDGPLTLARNLLRLLAADPIADRVQPVDGDQARAAARSGG